MNEKIKLGVSVKNYETKPDFMKVRYKTKEIDKEEFVYSIQNGYSFTHSMGVFGEYGCKEKTIANFDQTNFVWVDFDHSHTSLEAVWDQLNCKPSIGYTTISNKIDDYRFRLIYLIDFSINTNENYKYYLNVVLNSLINDLDKDFLNIIDNKCFNVAQTMFGSNQNCIVKSSDNIFNKDFFDNYTNNNHLNYYININNCSKKFNYSISAAKEKTYTVNENNTTTTHQLINELRNTDITNYQPIFSNKNNVILNDNDIYSYVGNQDIYEIKFLYSVTDDKYKKIPIGSRNNTLYTMGLITKNIQPDITLNDLAKNLYWIYTFRTEKGENFSLVDVCKIAESAYNTDVSNFTELGKRKYIINPEYRFLPKKEKIKALGVARREKRNEDIFSCYDLNKSIAENAQDLSYSPNTIRKALKENQLSTDNQKKFENFCIAICENPTASIRDLMKLTGLSDKTVQKYKKRFFEIN